MPIIYPQLDGVKINKDLSLPVAVIQAIRKTYDYIVQVAAVAGLTDANVLIKVGAGGALAESTVTDTGTEVDLTTHIGKYKNAATAGIGVPAIYAVASFTNRSSSIATVNLLVGGLMAPAGLYRITAYVACRTAGAGNVTLTIGYNDGIGAKTSHPTTALTAGTFNPSNFLLYTNGSAHVTYATTYVATGTYDLYLALERLT